MTFSDVEAIFLKNNYRLLAQRFNIAASEGSVRQAKLWSNPVFFIESNLYDPINGKLLNYGPVNKKGTATDRFNWGDNKQVNGTFSAQLNQLILTAGKRSKLVQLARDNRDVQSAVFNDLLRALHYDLYSAFVLLYYDLESVKILQEEESQLVRLIDIELVAPQQGSDFQDMKLPVFSLSCKTSGNPSRTSLIRLQMTKIPLGLP